MGRSDIKLSGKSRLISKTIDPSVSSAVKTHKLPEYIFTTFIQNACFYIILIGICEISSTDVSYLTRVSLTHDFFVMNRN